MKNKKYYIIDEVLTPFDLNNFYKSVTSDNIWRIDRSTQGSSVGTWAGLAVWHDKVCYNTYWFGRTVGILENIKNAFIKKYNFPLPNEIKRIHFSAKNNTSNADFHLDTLVPYTWTIVGFMTPEWSKEWGGELNIEGETIDFVPGRFVIFKSDLKHNGSKINKEINHWKLSLNYVLEEHQ
jgi:hypothetical protein